MGRGNKADGCYIDYKHERELSAIQAITLNIGASASARSILRISSTGLIRNGK